jgi:4-hydroxy-tetrahydrodipicolinate reductase
MPRLALAIAGAAGRMGQALVRAVLDEGAASRFAIVGATERPDSPAIGKDIGVVAGREALGLMISDDPAIAAAHAQAWIDFTSPAATRAALNALPGRVRAAIIGTTGFTLNDAAAIAAHAHARAIVQSGNFSLGVAMLRRLVRQSAASLITGWDIEVVEAHHNKKVDAPSGTALMLAHAAAEGRGVLLDDVMTPPYQVAQGQRAGGAIGMAVIRGGGIVGDHSVLFASEREVLTLSHRALDRSVFADGALAAALWAQFRAPGLYSIDDVLDR